jgi:hypothetical protein
MKVKFTVQIEIDQDTKELRVYSTETLLDWLKRNKLEVKEVILDWKDL